MQTNRLLSFASAVLLAGVAGCAPTQPTDLHPSEAIVFGTLATESGAPVPNATVRLRAHRSACSGPMMAEGTTQTGPAGTYRLHLKSMHTNFDACIASSFTPPQGAGLQETTVEGTRLRFNVRANDLPLDSVRMDVTLKGL